MEKKLTKEEFKKVMQYRILQKKKDAENARRKSKGMDISAK